MPQIAAIICTHNRDNYLGAAIDSLLTQEYDDFEVLVVDNGSTDSTKAVVESRLHNPQLKYIYEPVLGLSVARNTGAKETTAPILAYLDDDAEASPQWLRVLIEAYNNNEKLAIAGGKVTLIWPDGIMPPKWISSDMAAGLGAYDLGDGIVEIDNPNLTPRGLNYSMRRAFLEQIGGFDANLGRVGKKLLSNEELYMTELALKNGWQVAYLPDALAAHNVAPERVKPDWFLRRSWWQGISECYREEVAGRTGIGQLGRGGERLVRGLYKSLKYINDPALRFDNLLYAYGQIGYLSSAIQTIFKSRKSEVESRK
ncbi:glycosyltransferase family 2 protein [Candidatus Gracilibacteria bacterium]|jgi:glycosyltransferase involved in cell wall biosynthesis|nr:glycosyltransferase family 2 protein [Candidatus Gracilibacteria bacterium]NJM86203.1 glycosyltransferase family 2 protein [Hydrococcus sp. RU_2_2]NJP17742.1 glycosyltransferase family 2 protein [Hydrococcus sp. CRU_1_1]